ncbi:hypothetical protein ABT227_35495, partial [Streptomyces venezuelae]
DRLIYQARLQARYGRSWRRKAPVEALMPLKLAKIGVPLAQTTPDALAATGIEPAVLPPVEQQVEQVQQAPALAAAAPGPAQQGQADQQGQPAVQQAQQVQQAQSVQNPAGVPGVPGAAQHVSPAFAVDPTAMPAAHNSAWFAAPLAPQAAYEGGYNPQYVEGLEPTPVLPPMGPDEEGPVQQELPIPAPRQEEGPQEGPQEGPETPDEAEFAEVAYKVFCALSDEKQDYPSAEALDIHLSDGYGVTHPRSGSLLRRMIPAFKLRYNKDREAEHIA